MKMKRGTVVVEVLMAPGCGHGQLTVELVRAVLDSARLEDVRLETLAVRDLAEAERRRFPGSPTVRINGNDIEPGAPAGVGLG